VAEKGEAFPIAPLEAMACGCAPVVSDLRCFDDAITDGENGWLFDHRDDTGKPLAALLERLMTSDELRIRTAEAAKQRSRDYTPQAVAQLFLEDFAELTGLPIDTNRTEPVDNARPRTSMKNRRGLQTAGAVR
jgi:glycosyltransferase involved in cell wall biosynthesis